MDLIGQPNEQMYFLLNKFKWQHNFLNGCITYKSLETPLDNIFGISNGMSTYIFFLL